MAGYIFVRLAFVAAVVYGASVIRPVEGGVVINGGLGLAVALAVVLIEARLRDTAVTSLLGGLLGFWVFLMIAKALGTGLFWADTANTKVKFLHMLILVVLPFLGAVIGARMGVWLEPAKLVSLFRDARPQKRYR